MDPLQPRPDLYNVTFAADSFNGMPHRRLGRSGLRVSNVGLGTWKFGFPDSGDGSRVDEPTAYQILDRAIVLGVTFWDTANRYNNASGNSERILGRWLRQNSDQRRNVVLATKCYGGMDGSSPNHSRLSRTNILESVYASLARMQVEYLDVLYFHRFDTEAPADESLSAIDDLVRRDLVRYFAVSNFSADQLSLYRALERDFGPRVRVTAVQNRFDILTGEDAAHSGVLDYCARHEISYVAYSPLAKGLLTERYLEPSKAGPGDRLYDEGELTRRADSKTLEILQSLSACAREWNLKLGQLALAYMLTLPGMGPLIPSSSSIEQLEANAAAGKVALSAEQCSRVREILAGRSPA
ncbi:MAG: aldo/keto reductase [Planctomycetes bacterium]|nr:aldo/keto reductase [Planctomycetota bacterium]